MKFELEEIPMKRCTKCGAIQNDSRHHCIDCGEKLGKPLSEAEALEIEERLGNTLDDMSDRTEDFYVPLRDKIMGVISVFGIVAAIVLLILVGRANNEMEASIPDGVIVDRGAGFTTIISNGEIDYQYPSADKERIDNAGISALIALSCFAVAIPMLTIPKVMWFIDTLRYRIFFNWDTSPSDFALFFRKAITYILFASGIMGVLYGYWIFF